MIAQRLERRSRHLTNRSVVVRIPLLLKSYYAKGMISLGIATDHLARKAYGLYRGLALRWVNIKKNAMNNTKYEWMIKKSNPSLRSHRSEESFIEYALLHYAGIVQPCNTSANHTLTFPLYLVFLAYFFVTVGEYIVYSHNGTKE